MLAEFSYVALHKYRLSAAQIGNRVESLRRMIPVDEANANDLPKALHLVAEHKLGFWDALLCTTAARADVRYLLSDDMQDGPRIGNLAIVSPFRVENAALVNSILHG